MGRRSSVAARRGSVANIAAPKLAKRLELQKIFNTIPANSEGAVDRRNLMVSIMKNPEVNGCFTSAQADELGYKGEGGATITWDEFLEFVQKTEDRAEAHNSSEINLAAIKEAEEYTADQVISELVEPQAKALEIDVNNGNISVTLMDTDDIRVVMSDHNKLIVGAHADALELLSQYVENNGLAEEHVPVLLDYVERAIIKASQQELRLLQQGTTECVQQMEAMADLVLSAEASMIAAMEESRRAAFVEGAASAGRRGSIQQNLKVAVGADDDVPTPGNLARKLLELQQRSKVFEAEIAHYEKVAFQRRASQAALLKLDLADDDREREEWRKEVDSRLATLKAINTERATLIRENNVLRASVECGRQRGMSRLLREKIAEERRARLEEISELENDVAALDAELRVALEDREQIDTMSHFSRQLFSS